MPKLQQAASPLATAAPMKKSTKRQRQSWFNIFGEVEKQKGHSIKNDPSKSRRAGKNGVP
jgi:hypothetical protein